MLVRFQQGLPKINDNRIEVYKSNPRLDIIEMFEQFDTDGYKLVKLLENPSEFPRSTFTNTYICGNSELVRIMDKVESVKQIVLSDLRMKWVKQNKLKIPDQINKLVTVKFKKQCDLTKDFIGIIESVKEETFEVVVNIDSKLEKIPIENIKYIMIEINHSYNEN